MDSAEAEAPKVITITVAEAVVAIAAAAAGSLANLLVGAVVAVHSTPVQIKQISLAPILSVMESYLLLKLVI